MVSLPRVILFWLMQFFIVEVLVGAEVESAPIIDWALQQLSQSATSKLDRLPAEFSLTKQDLLQFGADRPHAVCLSGKHNPFQVRLNARQLADLPTKNMSLQIWVRPEKHQTDFGLLCLQHADRTAWLLGGGVDHFFSHSQARSNPDRLSSLRDPFIKTTNGTRLRPPTMDSSRKSMLMASWLAKLLNSGGIFCRPMLRRFKSVCFPQAMEITRDRDSSPVKSVPSAFGIVP